MRNVHIDSNSSIASSNNPFYFNRRHVIAHRSTLDLIMQEDVPIYSTPSIASSRQSHFSRRHREVEAVSMESFQIGKIFDIHITTVDSVLYIYMKQLLFTHRPQVAPSFYSEVRVEKGNISSILHSIILNYWRWLSFMREQQLILYIPYCLQIYVLMGKIYLSMLCQMLALIFHSRCWRLQYSFLP
jgi:hypothetical protein